jgi:hypothetical protein
MNTIKSFEECPDPACCGEAPSIVECKRRAMSGTNHFRETKRHYYECSLCGLEFTTAESREAIAALWHSTVVSYPQENFRESF